MMNRRQFFILFLCNLIPWWVGAGLVSLLPLYAAQLGASPAVVGNYLSFIFLALAGGTMVGGWLAARVRGFRQLLMTLAAISGTAILLIGHVAMIWQLILLSVAAWFASGITLALVMILVGAQAEENKRGHIFGLLTAATSLGGVLGGVTGFIVDHWGYGWLFALAGATWFVQVFIAFFLVNPPQVARPKAAGQTDPGQARIDSMQFATAFLLLLASALLFSTANFAGFLGRTLAMEALSFSNAAITFIAALGSALGLVANPLLGRLSDRGGRRFLLGVLYLVGGLGLVFTVYARTMTDFVIVAALLAFSAAERGISTALVSDFLPGHALSRGLSLFESTKWLGGVVGLAGAGYVIEYMGLSQVLLWSALLSVLATLLLLFLRKSRARAMQTSAPQLDPV